MRRPFGSLQTAFTDFPTGRITLAAGRWIPIREACENVCSHCYQREICWGSQSQEMYRGTERMLRSMEAGDPQDIQEKKSDWMSVCSRFVQYYEALKEGFQRERQRLIWDNRMIESRLAVAQQLQEMSRIMDMVADDLYDISLAEPSLCWICRSFFGSATLW